MKDRAMWISEGQIWASAKAKVYLESERNSKEARGLPWKETLPFCDSQHLMQKQVLTSCVMFIISPRPHVVIGHQHSSVDVWKRSKLPAGCSPYQCFWHLKLRMWEGNGNRIFSMYRCGWEWQMSFWAVLFIYIYIYMFFTSGLFRTWLHIYLIYIKLKT